MRTHASPKVGQDQVSGRVIVPCWHATPVADALWKQIFGEMSDSVIMSRPGIMSQTGTRRWGLYDGSCPKLLKGDKAQSYSHPILL